MGVDIKLTSHVDEIKNASEEAIERALEAMGIQAVAHAKQYISSDPVRVDTGLLRNSITYALAGKPAAIESYEGSETHTKDSDSAVRRGLVGKPAKGPHKGTYSGNAPSSGKNDKAVYVGTNVEYAIYVHEGTSKMSANRFIKNAVMKHKDEYKAIAEQELKKG